MNKKGRTSAFVLGLISGIFNMLLSLFLFLFGIIASTGTIPFSPFLDVQSLLGLLLALVILIFVAALINLIGGCICRRSRTVGGVMMLITALPLLIVFFAGVVSVTTYPYYGTEGAFAFLIFYLLIQVMSIIGAIIAFIPPKDAVCAYPSYTEQPPYAPYGGQPYQTPYPSCAPPCKAATQQTPAENTPSSHDNVTPGM